MSNKVIIGIDVGGTKISFGRISSGRMMAEAGFPTHADRPEQLIVDDIMKGIEILMTPDVIGIGIGVPGFVDEENGIVYNVQNIPSWKEVLLKKYLELRFKKQVSVSNDANCFAQGEKFFGQGKNFRNMVGITLGTGVGTGIIINDQLYTGSLSAAGEFGSIPYLKHNYEHYCSGKFFKEFHDINGKEVHERALLGDARAIRIFDEYGAHLGNFIKTILLALGPEAIILGGSVTKSFRFFQKAMMESIYKLPFKRITDQLIIKTSDNDRIAVMGAAALIFQKTYSFEHLIN